MDKPVVKMVHGIGLVIKCPGCGEDHALRAEVWSFNGDMVRPTFSPSLHFRTGHYMSSHQPGKRCWCDYNAEHPDDPAPCVCYRCHSFVTDGQIQFLSDSTHELAGKTVPLEPF